MKKILIATWCNNNGKTNYGQVLQAYALQKYLLDLGNDVKIINYINMVQSEKNISRVRKFNIFLKKNIKLTKKYYNIKDLDKEISDTDILIAGSDQIWNPANIEEVYFLNFGSEKIRRVSYASSGIFFENKENSQGIEKISNFLRNFYSVSVREEISATILEKYLKYKPEVVCDPVFLLSSEKWIKVSKEYTFSETYILCYIFGGIRNKQSILESYRKIFNAEKIIVISSNWFSEKFLGKR